MARKNGLKRLLMYVVVIIGSLFVSFLAFYFARNEETIALGVNQGEIIYLNAGNTEALPLQHLKASKSTEITIDSSNEDVVRYQKATKTLDAVSGGVATITITTTNKDFGPFKFDVFVGDGSSDFPWYISTSKQFSQIGKGLQEITREDFQASHSYELINDIDLGNLYLDDTFWTPIPTFQGVLQGEGYNVLNLKIISNNIDNVGLFGTLDSTAIIENINFVNAEIVSENAKNVGIIAGVNKGFIGKVKLNGKITSSSETTVVGGVVGRNQFEINRPLLNMVEAKVSFETKGLTGGLVGINKSGIIFNSAVQIKDINVYTETAGEPELLSNENEPVVATFGFGGVAGENIGVVYGEDFRQSANKNVFVKFENISVLDKNQDYISKIGTVAYTNSNGPVEHTYYTANNYINVIVLEDKENLLTELGNNTNLADQDKTNIAKHNDATFSQASDVEEFGLTSIWMMDKVAKVLTLDFEASYENPQISNPGAVISRKIDVIKAIEKIYTTTNPLLYNVDIDLFEEDIQETNGEKVLVIYGHEITGEKVSTQWGVQKEPETDWTEWTPITSKNTSYNGEFIVSNGRVIIKNLIINQGIKFDNGTMTYYGLFAQISGKHTIVQNLGVENVKINANETERFELAGGFAGGISDATVEGITVDGIEINNANTAGFVFGTINNATVKNVSVGNLEKLAVLEEEVEEENFDYKFIYVNPPNRIFTSTTYPNNVNFGGLTGKLSSSIDNISVHYGLIRHQGLKESRIGGITGTQYSNITIKDAKVNHAMQIENKVTGKGYFGGISGYVLAHSTIEHSFSLASINVISAEEESHAGGIAGYLASGSVIRHSFAGDQSSGEVSARNVGGIVSINHGSIYQSQAAGAYTGHNVGGAAYINYGNLESVLITAKLEGSGTSSSNTVAGIAVYMPEGSLSKYIISTAQISGEGNTKLYAETASTVRYTAVESVASGIFNGKLFSGTHKVGNLENYIVVGYGNAIRQKGIMGNSSFWIKVVESTENELRLQGGSNPYVQAGFVDLETFIWRFEAGELPELINIAQNPFLPVEDSE